MRLLQREWLLWRKRVTLWVLLGSVVVMAYFGYIDYLNPAVWKTQKEAIELFGNKTEEEKERSYELLAQSVWMMAFHNSLFSFFPMILIGASFGVELHTGRSRGTRLAGMRPGQLFGASVCMNLLLVFGMIFLGTIISLWKVRGIWWGHLGQAGALFVLRPLLQVVLNGICCSAMAYLCFTLFWRRSLVIPYLVYLLLLFVLSRGMQAIARLAAWGTTAVVIGGSFPSYYFWDVDTGGLQNAFFRQVEDPLQWKLWGETMYLEYAAAGVLLFLLAWGIFQRSQRAA